MHGLRLLHKRLFNCGVIHHVNRLDALMKVVRGLLDGGTLTLTHLGRSLPGTVYEKHKIKCVDRLLGNSHLHIERKGVYRQMARWLLCHLSRPVILVDWSDVYEGQEFVMLTAAVPMGGRAFILYDAVYPMRQYNSPGAHKRFLHELREVVPENKQPIIITDAGFRGPWFREVEKLGWDWVGRLRRGAHYSLDKGKSWAVMDRLYRQASFKIRYIGQAKVGVKQPYECHVYLVKKNIKGDRRPAKRYGDNALAIICRKLYKDPWVLATSLAHHRGAARKIEKLYALRMQVEETFRDMKNGRWGFGLEYARSYHAYRLEVLLLIAALATFVVWLNGVIIKLNHWTRHFQANTENRSSVLSIFFLGKRLLLDGRFKYKWRDVNEAFKELPNIAQKQVEFVGIY